MKILVAGGSGFIGGNFLLKTPRHFECVATYNTSDDFPSFLQRKKLDHVRPVRVDMRDSDSVRNAFDEIDAEFDACLYVMGNSDIALARRDPLRDVRANVHSLVNLLRSVHVGKFVFMSSGAVYEGQRALVDPSMPVAPTIPYSIDKLSSELFIRYYQENTDHIDNYVNLRFFGAYGPMEPARKIYTNLIKAFVFENESTYKIIGNGKNLIDAMYIDDAVDALLKVVTSDKGNMTVDFCFGRPLTINELILETGRVFGKNVALQHEGAAAEYTTFYASPRTMESLFGFKPSIDLSEGIRKFAEYLKAARKRRS